MWKTPNEINGITPEEIKSDLLADYGCCSACKYGKSTYDNPYGCAEKALKMQVADNALAYIQQLECERDEALEFNKELVETNNNLFAETVEMQGKINDLRKEFEQVKRERDAAVKAMKYMAKDLDVGICCETCSHYAYDEEDESSICADCDVDSNWQWRGIWGME